MDKVDRALELQVIDWLQWAEFKDDLRPGHGDADKAALALQLISKRKVAYDDLKEHADRLADGLEKVQHSVANAWEWQCSDPEDSEMDRDQQIGNWCKKACDQIKEALAAYRAQFPKDGE